MPEQKVTLKVSGVEYGGWTSVSITTALESFYRSFSVVSSRKANDAGVLEFGIAAEDEVEVFIDDDKVLTGYVTKVSAAYGATGIDLRVDGVGAPWVMCKSSLPYEAPKTYDNMPAVDVLRQICGYFGVELFAQIDTTDKWSISFSADEEIQGKLTDLVKKKTVLLSEDESGRLVLTQPGGGGRANDVIQNGVNVLEARLEIDAEKLYGKYIVYGQGANPTSTRPVSDNQLVGCCEGDALWKRVLAKKQSGNAIQTELDARAGLLRDYLEATAKKLTYKVHGWRQSNGELWRVNTSVRVDDSNFVLKENFLIAGVSYSLSSSGTVSTLQLVPLAAINYVNLESAEEKAKAASESRLTSIGKVGSAGWTSS